MTLGIVELRGRCGELAAVNEQLFETLGAWIADTEESAAQQLFAAASHRHAWHARLWHDRRPAIPVDVDPGAASWLDADAPPGDRVRTYRDVLDRLTAAGAELRAATDPVLDPGTRRVVDLVAADLAELAGRVDRVTRDV